MAFETERTELAALADSIQAAIDDRQAMFPTMTRSLTVWRKDVDLLYTMYRSVLARAKAQSPTIFGTLPDRPPEITPDTQGGERVDLADLRALLRDVRHCLGLMPPPAVQVSMSATREGVFFAGERTDAMKLVLDIIGMARRKLEVIDGYIDLGLLSLLTRDPKVEVEVLTKLLDASATQALTTFANGKRLQVRTSGAFHDRFICVDGGDVYHFGASFKDAGGRGFMFSRIEEPTIVKALRDEWARAWTAATKVV